MSHIRLHDRLMTPNGILNRLKELLSSCDRIDSSQIDEEQMKRIYQGKIKSLRDDLRSIFFETLAEKKIVSYLASDSSVFLPDYDLLRQTLLQVFSHETLDEMIKNIESLKENDWEPNQADLEEHYNRLNEKHEYFFDSAQAISLMNIFRDLVIACRKVSVLIEKNNTSDDIAYHYAYTLMALLIDEEKIPKNFQEIARRIENFFRLSDQSFKADTKPFHDLLLSYKLPGIEHDRSGWLALLMKEGGKVLPFFGNAKKIEEKNKGAAPDTLKKAKEVAASLRYERADKDREWAQLCYTYDVPEGNFDVGLDYILTLPWPKKSTDEISDTIVRENGYVWTKLSPNDKRGLILGKITDCCQSIGDDSSQCVIDAMGLNENALYVLLKQKKTTPNLFKKADGSINDDEYQIIGQSYVWKSKSGNLCLDSIECLKNSIQPEDLKLVLSKFAEQVLSNDNSIKRVTIGAGGKTPENLFETTVVCEHISQGCFYGDAMVQYLITKKPHRLTAEQQRALSGYNSPFKDCMLYLSDYLADTTDFIERTQSLVERNPKLPAQFSVDALHKLLSFTKSPCMEDLEFIDFDHLQPKTIYSTGRLMWQVDTPEKMLQALLHIRLEDQLAAVKNKYKQGETLLSHVVTTPERIQEILSLYLESERLLAVQNKNVHGETLLRQAARLNPESLKVILSLLPESERFLAVKEKNENGETLLHQAAIHPDSLKMVLNLYPESERLAVVQEKDFSGETLLFKAVMHPDSLKMVLDLYFESERLAAVNAKNRLGDTPLRRAAPYPDSLKMVLDLYSESERLLVVKEKNIFGETLLLQAAHNPNSLKMVLDLYPEPERLLAVKEKNRDKYTVLHLAATHPDLLKMILSLYPEPERLLAVKEKNVYGVTPLQEAARLNPESLEVILSLLPESERLLAVKERNRDGDALLQQAVTHHPDSLKMILSLLPESERLLAVQNKNEYGETLLYQVATSPDSLKIILSLLPESERLLAVQNKNEHGETLLYQVATSPDSLKIILSLLPESERLLAVKKKNSDGGTPLQKVARLNPDSLKMILSLYPESERLAALQEEDVCGTTPLLRAKSEPKALEMILSLLPINDLIQQGCHECNKQNISFDTLKESIVNKATELHYSPEHLNLIEQANDMIDFQKTWTVISQNRLKESLENHKRRENSGLTLKPVR
jgi:hypothetical protein